MMRSRYASGDGTIERARALRREATSAEQRFWSIVRNRGLGDAKFRRQQRFGRYVADFVCHEAKLIIEIDGDTHVGTVAERHDAQRTRFLESEGYQVLRFGNADVHERSDGVAAVVLAALAPSPSHSASPSGPLPLPQGGEGL